MNKKYTFPIGREMATARSTKRISTISATAVCRKINRMDFIKAKDLVSCLLEKSKSIGGKYYTKTAKNIMEVLESVENNAVSRGFEPEQMRLRISAHKGPNRMRSRRKRSFGVKLKISHVHAVLENKKTGSPKKKYAQVERPRSAGEELQKSAPISKEAADIDDKKEKTKTNLGSLKKTKEAADINDKKTEVKKEFKNEETKMLKKND